MMEITSPAEKGTAHAGLADREIYDDGYLRVEYDNYYTKLGGRVLRLPRKEFLIMSRLARSAERIVTSEEIWRHGWGLHTPVNPKSLHVHIYRLRRRLEPFGVHIETMVNVGYRLATATPDGVRDCAASP